MMDLQSTPLIDTTIKPNSMCQSSSSSLPSSNNLLNQCNNLIKEAKNFNLHANVLKQLLNLKDRASGYEIYARRQSVETINTINSASSGKETSINLTNKCNNQQSIETLQSTSTIESIDLENLLETIKKLSDEVIESHRLGFCLAYNIQCLHKRLTGSPIDLHSSANMIRKLQEKYDSFKTREAILKYEFQEKRKLLRRLRSQLEETREDWRVLRVTKRRPERRAERNENDDENDIPDDDALWSETLRRQFASKRKQPSEESGFIETNNRGEGVEVSSSPSSTSSSTSDDNNQGTSSGTTSDQPTKITRTTGYEDLAIALDNRRAKLDYLEDECYNLFQTLSARSTATVTANDNYTNNNNNLNNQLNGSTTIPIVSPLLFSDDLTDDQLLLDDDDDDEDEEEEEIDDEEEVDENEDDVDELSDPLSDEFDELNLPVDTLDPIDATEEIDTSDLPWDSNNLYESRATSLVTTDSHNQMSPNNLQNNQMTQDDEGNQSTTNLPSSLTLSQSNMVHIGVGMDDDDDEDDEYTQQEMESLAETGEPLVLCRLRRRAVEILISRLRDEKILHQSRESELNEQLDKLRRLNDSLTLKLNNLKSNDWSLRSTGQLNSILITSMVTLFTASVFVYFFK